uniref:Uncharacterized protein n=1 Tax=Pyxicephalus adspersus TaxID=30357 RepID=A0AAV2ZGW1_PYXAD|nr:TPA: hypothetical protein GDO54_005010 [Pyxicephalus adspersus]
MSQSGRTDRPHANSAYNHQTYHTQKYVCTVTPLPTPQAMELSKMQTLPPLRQKKEKKKKEIYIIYTYIFILLNAVFLFWWNELSL